MVPVVGDVSLKAAEDIKLQIVTNMLNSGASLGSDSESRNTDISQSGHFSVSEIYRVGQFSVR